MTVPIGLSVRINIVLIFEGSASNCVVVWTDFSKFFIYSDPIQLSFIISMETITLVKSVVVVVALTKTVTFSSTLIGVQLSKQTRKLTSGILLL